jgi:hypothetical protein
VSAINPCQSLTATLSSFRYQKVLFATLEFEQDALGSRRDDAGPDAAFGVDLWVLFARLI